MNHKTKSFTYWRARFNEPYDYTLQDLLLSAFNNTAAEERREAFDEENEEMADQFNFINHKAIYDDFFCANFFGYEKGKIEQIIKAEEFDKEEITSTPFTLPGNDQFLDGKLYFVCFGNHLIASQDLHLKVLHLARYLNNMFHKRCKEFPEEQQLTPERTIRRTRREEIKGAKRINLSSPLPSGRSSESVDIESRAQSYSVGDRVWDAIEILTGKSLEDILQQFRQFDTRGIVETKDIDVTLSFIWRRKKGERFSDRVDALANAFSYIDDEIDVQIETNSGILKYNELRMRHSQSVAHINGMPDNYDIFKKMREWYRTLVLAGDIG